MSASTEPRIEHLVVLMLENRSFDHMLGFLRHPHPENFNRLSPGSYYNISSAHERIEVTSDGEPELADPDHSHEGVLEQIDAYQGVRAMGGFVRSYEGLAIGNDGRAVMRCLDPERCCPVLAELAKEFAVCVQWFSSVPGETWPNRNFAHAATSDRTTRIEIGLYYDPTIFELIAGRGATWRIYHDGVPQVLCFRRLWQQPSILDRVLGRKAPIANWYLQPEFFEHVARGDLPSYAFIEPAHMNIPGQVASSNSQHPNNNRGGARDFYAGERLIKNVYEALISKPELFAKTLLVVTYDEHGGFYDHVPPPDATPPGDPLNVSPTRGVGRFLRSLVARLQGKTLPNYEGFDFTRLGVRVPTVLISPWIKPGTIIDDPLEHASIPATLRALFAPNDASLTRRDRDAHTFHQVVRDHALAAPRGGPPGPSAPPATATGPRKADVFLLPTLKERSGVRLDVEATSAATLAATPPPSEFDVQLIELSHRVREELRPKPLDLPWRRRPIPTTVPTAELIDERTVVAVATEEFTAAARAARGASHGHEGGH